MIKKISPQYFFSILIVFLILTFIASLSLGASEVSLLDIVTENLSATDSYIITELRFPRTILAFLVGAGLALTGAVMQTLFRNPLADPSLIGVSSGAALGAALFLVFGASQTILVSSIFFPFLLPLSAFIGGLLATGILVLIGQRQHYTSVSILLLAGIALNALAGSGIGLLTYLASDVSLRSFTFWTLGSLAQATWPMVGFATFFIGIALVILPFFSKAFNALLLGEAEARHLGIPVERVKRIALLLCALAIGAAVAAAGIIAFVGLVVPHIVRLLMGANHRYVLPGSILLGGSLLMLADIGARTFVVPAELPIGIITALIGAPFFLALIMRERKYS